MQTWKRLVLSNSAYLQTSLAAADPAAYEEFLKLLAAHFSPQSSRLKFRVLKYLVLELRSSIFSPQAFCLELLGETYGGGSVDDIISKETL